MDTNKFNMTKEEYKEYVDKKSENSPILKNVLLAFLVGGIICIIGQVVTNCLIAKNIDEKTAKTFSTVFLIFLGAFLTSFNLYSKLGKYAGAGSVVPITGFSNSIVAPAIEYKAEGYILGLGSNMFKIAGPVLVYGIFCSFIYGVIYYVITMIR
ncbi:MAG: stage V sporulation protein AC [Clostridia bacterium]|nr:stage V sporulation protein AC [Clostridia bacterium]